MHVQTAAILAGALVLGGGVHLFEAAGANGAGMRPTIRSEMRIAVVEAAHRPRAARPTAAPVTVLPVAGQIMSGPM